MTWQRAASVAGEGADEDPAEGVANRRQSSPPRKEGRESESESEKVFRRLLQARVLLLNIHDPL